MDEPIYMDTLSTNWRTRAERLVAWSVWWRWYKVTYGTTTLSRDDVRDAIDQEIQFAFTVFSNLSDRQQNAIEMGILTSLASLYESLCVILQMEPLKQTSHDALHASFVEMMRFMTNEVSETLELYGYIIQSIQTIQENLLQFNPSRVATRIAAERLFFMGQFLMGMGKSGIDDMTHPLVTGKSAKTSSALNLFLSAIDLYDKMVHDASSSTPGTSSLELLTIDRGEKIEVPVLTSATSPRRGSMSVGSPNVATVQGSVGHHRRVSSATPPTVKTGSLVIPTKADTDKIETAIKNASVEHKKTGRGVVVNMVLNNNNTSDSQQGSPRVAPEPDRTTVTESPRTTTTAVSKMIGTVTISSSYLPTDTPSPVMVSGSKSVSLSNSNKSKSGKKKRGLQSITKKKTTNDRQEKRKTYSWLNANDVTTALKQQQNEENIKSLAMAHASVTPNIPSGGKPIQGDTVIPPETLGSSPTPHPVQWQPVRYTTEESLFPDRPSMPSILQQPDVIENRMSLIEILLFCQSYVNDVWSYLTLRTNPLYGVNGFIRGSNATRCTSDQLATIETLDLCFKQVFSSDMFDDYPFMCEIITMVRRIITPENLSDINNKILQLINKSERNIATTSIQRNEVADKARLLTLFHTFSSYYTERITQMERDIAAASESVGSFAAFADDLFSDLDDLSPTSSASSPKLANNIDHDRKTLAMLKEAFKPIQEYMNVLKTVFKAALPQILVVNSLTGSTSRTRTNSVTAKMAPQLPAKPRKSSAPTHSQEQREHPSASTSSSSSSAKVPESYNDDEGDALSSEQDSNTQ